jgi:predicted transcriptional regulator/DNA-binding XRE family transcriptional regulator
MRKLFMGARLSRLREERGLTQAALARQLDLSPSYLNQLERNQRPLTVQVLLRINAAFGIDVQVFSEDEEARLVADLRDALGESGSGVSLAEIKSLATDMPEIGRVLVALHRRARAGEDRLEALATMAGVPASAQDRTPPLMPPPLMPYEEVRDFFYDRHNHVAELDDAAERLFEENGWVVGGVDEGLEGLLRDRHGILVRMEGGEDLGGPRHFDAGTRVLRLSRSLHRGQRAFQMATHLAFLEQGAVLDALVQGARLSSPEARALGRIGLANYFAGALVLPYGRFLAEAEAARYDIDLLAGQFDVGFETICHRLSTLQRPGARGVPFFFVRVDRAGNISKRQSATDFHFSRVGGGCPLWAVHEAFESPGRILTQVARMPDDRAYLWIARALTQRHGGYGGPGKTFALGLGCDLRHASRLVYARGLDLTDPTAATPIGAGCKVCERPNCPQRAFPPMGRPLVVDEHRGRFVPYATT